MAGGGTTGSETGDGYTQGKPYDLYGQPNALMVQQIDEMFTTLFKALTRAGVDLTTINNTLDGGVGDVIGPSSAVADDIAVFNSTTGKLIKDGGYTIASLLAAGSSPMLASALTTIGTAAINTANTTPVQVLAAGGTNDVFIPVHWAIEKNITSGFGANPTFDLVWSGLTTPSLAGSINPTMNSTGTSISRGAMAAFNNISLSTTKGKALHLRASADTGAGAGTLYVRVYYITFVTTN